MLPSTNTLHQRAVVASWGHSLSQVFVAPEGGDCFASHGSDDEAAAAVAAAVGGGELVWKTLGNGGNNELAEACVCSPLQHDDDVLLLQSPHNLFPWLMSNKAFSRQIFGTFGHDVVGSIMRRCLKLKDSLQKRWDDACHTSHFTPHTSHLTPHLTPHTSLLTPQRPQVAPPAPLQTPHRRTNAPAAWR